MADRSYSDANIQHEALEFIIARTAEGFSEDEINADLAFAIRYAYVIYKEDIAPDLKPVEKEEPDP